MNCKRFSTALLYLASMLCALGADTQSSSEPERGQAKQRLDAYERGLLTLEEISGSQNITNPPVITNIVFYYQNHSNEVTLKMLLPISRCFMVMGKAAEAASLATTYLNVNSNDCRAWDILFAARCSEESYDKALIAGTNAIGFGCEKNAGSIGMVLLQARRFDLVDQLIIPRLSAQKNKEEDPRIKRQMLWFLTLYSVITTNKQLYISTLQGETAKSLRPNRDLRNWVKKGCELFKAKETEQICKELIEE